VRRHRPRSACRFDIDLDGEVSQKAGEPQTHLAVYATAALRRQKAVERFKGLRRFFASKTPTVCIAGFP